MNCVLIPITIGRVIARQRRRSSSLEFITTLALTALAASCTADGGAAKAAGGGFAKSAAASDVERDATPRVVIATELGEIEVELDAAHAPVTAGNFLRYVDAGHYRGGRFHRTVREENQPRDRVKIAVVQAGVAPDQEAKDFGPIPLEPTSRTGLRHLDGTISMARAAPDSATSDFFICVGDQPELDEGGRRNPDGRGFAAFGRVVRGMDVVRRIHAAPTDGQALRPPIEIEAILRRATPAPAARDPG